jgi:hypothetical protein
MKTVRVCLKLSKRSPSEKIGFWGNIKTEMTSNSNFASPIPSLSDIDTEMGIFADDIVAAKSGDHSKVAAKNAQEERVDNLLSQLGNYVEQTANDAAMSGGDAKAIINSAGMDVEKPKLRSPVPDTPTGLKGSSTIENEIELSWKNQKYVRAFIVEISSDISLADGTSQKVFTNWQITDVCHKPKIKLSGLTSGVKYAVRIISSGSAGKSNPSNVIMVKVL